MYELTSPQLKALRRHEYQSVNDSLIEPYLRPFWAWTASFVPLWMSPNTITTAGIILNLLTTLLQLWSSPDARQEVPRYVLLLAGVTVFIYQLLDNLDGILARRMQQDTAMEELFDHGSDALSTAFIAVGVSVCTYGGQEPGWMLLGCFGALVYFYIFHWEVYLTGVVRIAKFDPTEMQYAVMFVYLVSVLLGPAVWTAKLPVLAVELRLAVMAAYGLVCIMACWPRLVFIWVHGVVGGEDNKVYRHGFSALAPGLPPTMVVLLALVARWLSPSHLYEEYPCLFVMTFAIVFCKYTHRIIINHMAKSELPIIDVALLGPGLLIVNQLMGCPFQEHVALWICFVVCALDMSWHYVRSIRQIRDCLGLYCYSFAEKTPDVANVLNGVPKYQ